MIQLFRRIRQSLLQREQFSRYLLYALGEIVLVVIGILIALSINNRNEARKARIQEIGLLLELKADLEEPRADLLTDIEKAADIMATTNTLYKAVVDGQISEAEPFDLSTGYILDTATLFPKRSAYEAIQSEGITVISDDALRKMITDFYQLHLERVAAAEAYTETINTTVIKPYLNRYSRYGSNCADCDDLYALYEGDQANKANVFRITRADATLVHMLKEKFIVTKTLHQRYQDLSGHMDAIISAIDMETH